MRHELSMIVIVLRRLTFDDAGRLTVVFRLSRKQQHNGRALGLDM